MSRLEFKEQELINLPYPQLESKAKGDFYDQAKIDYQISKEIEVINRKQPHKVRRDSFNKNSKPYALVLY